MKTLKLLVLPVLVSAFIVLASATKDGGKETEKLNNSASVLKEFGKMKQSIPKVLMDEYKGIVIVPGMSNAGFGFAAKHGDGIAMVKMPNGKWSDPVFITLTGGNFGITGDAKSVDLILVFHHKGVLSRIKAGDFAISGDASAVAGPMSTNSPVSKVPVNIDAEVYSYSLNGGSFTGITIDGSNLAIDRKANATYYGDGSRAAFETAKNGTEAVKLVKETLDSL